MKFRILTYNIHKGYSMGSKRFILESIRDSIKEVHADLVHLQEVSGVHDTHDSQFEYLADSTWEHFAYGKNAIKQDGHHGNAILSKFPIISSENEDVSFTKFERRGLLHAVIDLPDHEHPLHSFCIHLGLFERDRLIQIQKLASRISRTVHPDAPILIAGDFNDWRKRGNEMLTHKLGFKEAFLETNGSLADTFPNKFPFLALDRIYYKNLECQAVKAMSGGIWRSLSDHLPLLAEFEI